MQGNSLEQNLRSIKYAPSVVPTFSKEKILGVGGLVGGWVAEFMLHALFLLTIMCRCNLLVTYPSNIIAFVSESD